MNKDKQFGELFRICRLQCHDLEREKYLTQARLAELLERETGILYTSANISSWERNKSRIDHDARIVLVGLIKVFHSCDGLKTLVDANTLLNAGNYRVLNTAEIGQVNPLWLAESQPLTAVSTPPPQTAAELTLADIPLTTVPSPGLLPSGTMLPLAANPLFVGRQEALQTLAHQMREGTIAIVTGLGGVGKTQLAVEFAHRYGRYFCGGVFWINFRDPDSISVQVANCGGACHMALRPDFDDLPLAEQVNLVQRAWQEPVPRLLIFDDCKEVQLVKWRQPHGGCRILVTNRGSRWDLALGARLFKINTLHREEGISLLCQFQPDMPVTIAAAIAAELGDLPLALHLAGSFLRHYQADVSPATYLAQLQGLRGRQLLSHPSLRGWGATFTPTNHDLHVNRTFALSYDRLNMADETDKLAQSILARAACLAPGEPIPRNMLLATLLPASTPSAKVEKDEPLLAANALARLVALGLVEESQGGAFLRLHRLVAEFVNGMVVDFGVQTAVEAALIDMARQCNKSDNPALLRPWQPHLQHVTAMVKDRMDEHEAKLNYVLGYHLILTADYQQAHLHLQRALETFVKVLGENHPDTIVCLNRLGMLLRLMGNLTAAQTCLERALRIQEQMFRPNHPDTVQTLQEMGLLLYKMGDMVTAQTFLERALHIREQTLGPNHPDTARSLNDLGLLMQDRGYLVQARQYYERALDIYEQTLEPNHPNTATSLQSLGILLWTSGDLTGAQRCYEQAYAICERVLGPNHPHTAFTLNGLGILHQVAGDLTGALPYFERAVAICEQILGGEHPDTAISLSNFGKALEYMGDLAGAESFLIRAQTIMEQALGPRHPHTAKSFHNLGELYSKMNEFVLAQQHYERALVIFEQILGSEHPQTKAAHQNLQNLPR